ncbi:TPA: hypothetical protein ACSKOW_002215, partial [Listeria innocua]
VTLAVFLFLHTISFFKKSIDFFWIWCKILYCSYKKHFIDIYFEKMIYFCNLMKGVKGEFTLLEWNIFYHF